MIARTTIALFFVFLSPMAVAENWPQWRGANSDGVAPTAVPPIKWDQKTNVKWKASIPGSGHASPIVWNDLVFVLTGVETKKADAKPAPQREQSRRGRFGPPRVQPDKIVKFVVMALDREDGSVRWQQTAAELLPHEGRHPTATYASATPATDGKHVYAYFGSRGLYCYDMTGKLVWKQNLGKMSTRNSFGEGSSLTLNGDKIIINWDHEGQSFITTLDKATGKKIWTVDRDERSSWSSPVVIDVAGQKQIIVSATIRIRGYELETGKSIWECSGMTYNVIPTPVYVDGIIYVASGFRGAAMMAIRPEGAKGDITNSKAVVWRANVDTPYTPSVVVYKGLIYYLKTNSGILSCRDAKTGKLVYGPVRLPGIGDIYSSPVAADDRIYLTSRTGTTLVLKHGKSFEVLETNNLGDGVDASPAVVDDKLFMRTASALYCISK
jgi:outer membrane protein assembly factor BamB